MLKRKMLLGALIASSLYVVPMPAAAQVGFYIDVAPPPVRYERAPVYRSGQVWVPGYWDWRGHRHVWVRGHYVRERPGYVYYAPRWEERDGRWFLERERWHRGDHHSYYGGRGYGDRYSYYGGRGYGDRDRDGIPNRYDNDRDNDGRPNHRDRDIDGDGVPNYRDAYPNNPRRY